MALEDRVQWGVQWRMETCKLPWRRLNQVQCKQVSGNSEATKHCFSDLAAAHKQDVFVSRAYDTHMIQTNRYRCRKHCLSDHQQAEGLERLSEPPGRPEEEWATPRLPLQPPPSHCRGWAGMLHRIVLIWPSSVFTSVSNGG